MKKKYIFPAVLTISAIIILIINLYIDVKLDTRISTGTKVPDFEIKDINSSRSFYSSDFKGKVLFINFWATWCKPCRDELPSINKLNQALSQKNDFEMITIAYNEDPAQSLKFLKKFGFNIPLYFDPFGKTANLFGVTGVPETYIINKEGIVEMVKIGPHQWNSKKNIDFILSLLK